MQRVRLTVELGPAAALERVLDVELGDVYDAVLLEPAPIEWTWTVEGVQMRMTARREDAPGDAE